MVILIDTKINWQDPVPIHDDIFGKRGIEGHNLNFKKAIYNPLLKNYS